MSNLSFKTVTRKPVTAFMCAVPIGVSILATWAGVAHGNGGNDEAKFLAGIFTAIVIAITYLQLNTLSDIEQMVSIKEPPQGMIGVRIFLMLGFAIGETVLAYGGVKYGLEQASGYADPWAAGGFAVFLALCTILLEWAYLRSAPEAPANPVADLQNRIAETISKEPAINVGRFMQNHVAKLKRAKPKANRPEQGELALTA